MDIPRTVSHEAARIAAILQDAGLDEARLKAELVLEQCLGTPRLHLLLDATRRVTADEQARCETIVQRLVAREPLQYIIGHVDFHGHRFRCDRRALIPRPETEDLVARIVAAKDVPGDSPFVVDVGTGTGCIAISLALAWPSARVVAVDKDPGALALARENATLLGAADRVEFREVDLLDGFAEGSVDVVVSNPPYIARGELDELPPEIRDHEPRRALDGGPSGLDLVERLVDQAFRALRPGGRLWIEIGSDQGPASMRAGRAAGFPIVTVEKDHAGLDRYLVCSKM